MNRIEQAQDILKSFNLPSAQQNQISALTFLALCNINLSKSWFQAERKSLTLSEIMEFSSFAYDFNYKTGSRESFRREAINPFIEYGIIEKNPDNPDLPKNSPLTHYAISFLVLNTIKKYETNEWNTALENFLRYKNNITNKKDLSSILIKNINIDSYKSIAQDNIELGRFNVFIGVNGCGKTNILEALATVSAERNNDLTFDGLSSRGVRIARPDLILSSFLKSNQKSSIDINLTFEIENILEEYRCSLSPANFNDIYTKWINLAEEELYPEVLMNYFTRLTKEHPGISGDELLEKANKLIGENGLRKSYNFDNLLSSYAIFDINTKVLRGISQSESKKTPLGINGEGLDLLISNFNKEEFEQLQKCLIFFDWLKEILTDKDDKYKISGLKPGRSISTLYFKDKYMQGNNNMFSAENSNEGVLHVLFYLALFISKKTPQLFAIDNIETALNPRLCHILITELVKLSKINHKQVLITTHNPAILDGLNLLDDDQRLFEVFRDDEGRTKTRRIKFKKDLSDKKFKLSEMWLKGVLGAFPKNF